MIKIQILGSGCAKCVLLGDNAEEAARNLGLEYELVKVTDVKDIVKFGVQRTPALAVNGKVKLVGKPATPAQIEPMLAVTVGA